MKKYIALLFLSVFSFSRIDAQTNGGVTLPGNELNNIDSSKINKTDSLHFSQTDTSANVKKKEPKPPYVHQFRIGVDVARLASNFIYKDKIGYEMQFDYLLRGNNYFVFETGIGKNTVDYSNLKYDNNGAFLKLGIDKNVIDIVNDKDYDIFFIGIRYGVGFGKRDSVTFFTPSYFGPPSEGGKPAESYLIHWGELTVGLRVEIFRQVFVGWNARIKFLLNSGEFQELAPSYVPGYGAGDKSTVAGGNFYISYGIRWGGK
jgi:hypothetical protein